MSTAQTLLHRIFALAGQQGDLVAANDLIAVDNIPHMASKDKPDRRMGLKQLMAALRIAFPDLHYTVEDEISTGDKAAAHWTLRGTHTGPFLGNRPTGRPIVAQGFIFARVENGRITEEWTLVDQMSILQQLGLIPPMGH